ncbi:hypothetical protein BU24DRAFT_458610 [Aaosphaeria arxii CBS 175.79]|uniref:Uncharacterized protein n=1 Tax=Aaosphaeria arxii CBS 175.79 TaxID=1450172 RepID=A0A6A5Y1U8_9PLEO|nr:uncharacterized protein BU24DRAFT_458610 [Aaosphaeria arxii CBS 175.79]KAF2018881.1 hypothetical protein BU24DRAFT_458610 [Aaosphaeria arxii CBS 175.79]
MKLSSATIGLIALCGTSNAWYTTIRENNCRSSPRYYSVIGTGKFQFNPWKGPPWNGWIENCSYFEDHGNRGPFRCDGPNPGFKAVAVKVSIGKCRAVDRARGVSQYFAAAPICNLRDGRDWSGFVCED